MRNSNGFNWKKKRMFFFVFMLFGFFALGGIVMLLWNALLPEILHTPSITYWQGLGVFILSRILFGGFHFRKPYGRRPSFANQEFREKFMNMSDEERQKFKQQWKERCGK